MTTKVKTRMSTTLLMVSGKKSVCTCLLERSHVHVCFYSCVKMYICMNRYIYIYVYMYVYVVIYFVRV